MIIFMRMGAFSGHENTKYATFILVTGWIKERAKNLEKKRKFKKRKKLEWKIINYSMNEQILLGENSKQKLN